MKERKTYIQKNLNVRPQDYVQLAALIQEGWKAVDILKLGIIEAQKREHAEKIELPQDIPVEHCDGLEA